MFLVVLFGIVMGAPEPWQSTPWTLWQKCAKWLLLILCWPFTLSMMFIDKTGWHIPNAVGGPFCIGLFVISGAFWGAVLELLFARFRNQEKHKFE